MERVIFNFVLAVGLLQQLVHSQTATTTTFSIDTDKSSLLEFKSQLHLNHSHVLFTNWSASASVCSWIGVTCGSQHQRVTALDISRMGLTGSLAPHLGNLSFLTRLDLSDNAFHGTVPPWLASLTRLRFLDMSFNSFEAPQTPSSFFASLSPRLELLDMSSNPNLQAQIPREIGNLRNLRVLRLRITQLSGSLPSELFSSNLSRMEHLDLSENGLEGTLPVDMCRHLGRLEELYLSDNRLHGEIPSSSMSGCSRLRNLYLSLNNFGGRIPIEIGKLRMLERLYLSFNRNLIGAIPEEIGNLTMLKELSVQANGLSGSIPPQVFNMSTLQILVLRQNNLSGTLPWDMCSRLTQLRRMNLCENQIFGPVPARLYECSALTLVDFSDNQLSGTIPTTIRNSTLLQSLALSANQLTGEIPEEIGSLAHLENLFLSGNMLNGPIPPSLLNVSTLKILSLGNNQLTGNLAPNLGYNLPNLQELQLSRNLFTVESLELSFITSLTSCPHLETLELGDNPLNGTLPPSIGNLSTSLQTLDFHNCNLVGRIPEEIGNLWNLTQLDLSSNRFEAGIFPESLGSMRSLQSLDLSRNRIGGALPNTLCQLRNLTYLFLSGNHFYGAIPDCVDNISSLRHLHLDSNNLNSSIPTSLWNIIDLLVLNLSSNSLVGSLAPEIVNLNAVGEIDLSSNRISGVIPARIGDVRTLSALRLGHNELQGSIPDSMGDIVNLEILDLSYNDLSGAIPDSLQELQHLEYLNVSFNGLNGGIPGNGNFKNFTFESFMFNQGLCGDPMYRVPPCRTREPNKPNQKLQALLISLGALLLVFIVVMLACIVIRRRRRKDKAPIPRKKNHFWSKGTPRSEVSYYKLLAATNGYNESNLLGRGGYGSVYKGTLGNGEVVAVKVFNMELEGAFKSFEVECEVLRNLRHRNLCKVIGCCSNQEFKALVLEYKPSGSLEKWLYSHNHFLNMFQRVDIMIHVACALEYLHEGYSVPVIHCDLKPSNILLDKNMTAQLCDFGVAKLLGDGESKVQTMTLATLGYIAPEYGTGGFVSVKSDVYSYGIILLEVFTRKKPDDEMFSGEWSIRTLVNDSMPSAVIDPNLLRPEEDGSSQRLDCLSSILELGLNCSVESPYERMSMKDVIAILNKIKLQLLGI